MQTIGFTHALTSAVPRVLAVVGLAFALLAGDAWSQSATGTGVQNSNLRQLMPGSNDGAVTLYAAQCHDGTWGTVSVTEGQDYYCAIAAGGKERCDKKWSLQDAGRSACGAHSQ